MNYLDSALIKRVDAKLERLNKAQPLRSTVVNKLKEQFQIEMTYNSNAIEGNSLTKKETYLVISQGITIKGKPLKDHLEAKDHYEALEYVYEIVQPQKNITLSEHLIRILHQLVVKKSDPEIAGMYRTGSVIITGSGHVPPDPSEIPGLMNNLIKEFNKLKNKLHPIELAALLHHKIVNIHPFFDGNGRTARLVMNVLLMRKGYPLSIILKNDRFRYYRLLGQADRGNLGPFMRFIAQSVERPLVIYLNSIRLKEGKTEKLYSLLELSKHVPYSSKYLNLLAISGQLEAHKQDRNWVSSLEAVKRYMHNRKRKRNVGDIEV